MIQRILALDVGDVRIGIAVSDPLGITAQGIETYTRSGDLEKDVAYILSVANKYKPVSILFGLPLNLKGEDTEQTRKVREFADVLTKDFDGKHSFFDERYTTVSAHKSLSDCGLSRKKHKKVVDKIAAVLILQAYLDCNGGRLV